MTTLALKNLLLLPLSVLHFSACRPDPTDQEAGIDKLTLGSTDTTLYHTLVITKVKKPWYAWRSLVVGRMRSSIPEYQAIKGLGQKFYAFTEGHQLFGGIYLWQSEKEARDWFNQAWFDRTEKKYGQKGIAEYYSIQSLTTLAKPLKNEGTYWAVLSLANDDFAADTQAAGLIKILSLKNAGGQPGYLTLWQNKESAIRYFAAKKVNNTYFDTPILLDNTQR